MKTVYNLYGNDLTLLYPLNRNNLYKSKYDKILCYKCLPNAIKLYQGYYYLPFIPHTCIWDWFQERA